MKNYFCISCHTLKGYIHCHGHYNHTIQQVFFTIFLFYYICTCVRTSLGYLTQQAVSFPKCESSEVTPHMHDDRPCRDNTKFFHHCNHHSRDKIFT
jgi:hypothetical protein